MTDLVAQLVAIRKAKGIKQSTVARRIGISQTAVSQFENGKYSPNVINLLRYATAIGAQITVEET